SDEQPFLVPAAARQGYCAQAVRGTTRQGIHGCASDARTGIGSRHCISRSLGTVVQPERLLIKACGRSGNLRKNVTLKRWRGQERLRCRGEDVPQSFGIHEKVSLVLLNRSTEVRSPLVVVLEGFWLPTGLKEVIFRVQIAARIVIVGAAVEGVCTGARAVVDLRSRHAPVLAGVTVANHGNFLYVVATEEQ